MNVEVSIPVAIGGYTGQRDAWESFEHSMIVASSGSIITLEDKHGSIKRRITFDLDDLNKALEFLRTGVVPDVD